MKFFLAFKLDDIDNNGEISGYKCEAFLWDMDGVLADVSSSYRTAIM